MAEACRVLEDLRERMTHAAIDNDLIHVYHVRAMLRAADGEVAEAIASLDAADALIGKMDPSARREPGTARERLRLHLLRAGLALRSHDTPAANAALERFSRVDLLFNNAGVSTFNPLREQTLADWDWVLRVNLWGVVHGIDAFLPLLREHGGPAHERLVHLMHLHAHADGVEQRDGELAAEVLTEVLQTAQHRRLAVRRARLESIVPETEAEMLEQEGDPLLCALLEVPGQHGVARIESNADGHRLAVAQVMAGQALQLVRRPVTIVQRARAA